MRHADSRSAPFRSGTRVELPFRGRKLVQYLQHQRNVESDSILKRDDPSAVAAHGFTDYSVGQQTTEPEVQLSDEPPRKLQHS
jgi:hypothetical protein